MSRRLVRVVARLLAVDPARALMLHGWLARAARGEAHLALERRQGPSLPFDPGAIRVFVGMMLVAISIGLGALLAFVREPGGLLLLAAAHGGVVLTVIQIIGLPWLLRNDVQLLGAWPVSSRELGLARLAGVLDAIVPASVALTALPLVVVAVRGRPPLLSGVLLACGIGLQALALPCGALWLAEMLKRRMEPRAARRALLVLFGAPLLGLVVASQGLRLLPDGLVERLIRDPPLWVLAGPWGWAASWGIAPSLPRALWGIAASGVGFGSLLVALARWVLPRGAVTGARAMRARRGLPFLAGRTAWSHRNWPSEAGLRGRVMSRGRGSTAGPLQRMLAPFAPGRAGRIVRRLATAHVRDDPHALWLLAGLAGLVAATLVAAFVDPARLEWLALPHPRIPVRGGIAFLLPAMALPVLVFPHLVHSSDAAAAWVLAGVDLSGREMLSAQRGVARGLIVAPIVVAAALLHLRAGTAVAVALSDLALVTLVAEAVLALVQRFYPVMPFSRARAAEGLELLPVAGLMMPAFAVAAVWMLTGYERLPMWSGRVLTWAVLVVTIQGLRRSLHRTIAGRPLPIETAPR